MMLPYKCRRALVKFLICLVFKLRGKRLRLSLADLGMNKELFLTLSIGS